MENELPSEYASLVDEIESMYEKDQGMRRRAILNKGIIENKEDNQLDLANTERMKEIILNIGWPTVSKVGDDISDKAWLLVQHADHDVEFQKQCLKLMKEASEDVKKENIAYLEDRIRVNEGRKQFYGTQFTGEGENYGPYPIEDADKVDERRMSMGMGTLAEYKKFLVQKYKDADKI